MSFDVGNILTIIWRHVALWRKETSVHAFEFDVFENLLGQCKVINILK